ncbi:MAG: hypothetical protein ACLGIN_03540 [Candidatus Sericytochromatia bacterium]
MSMINRKLESRIEAVRKDAHYRPIIDQVKAKAGTEATTDQVLKAAVCATRDQFKREGKTASDHTLREQAFLAATVASVEQPMTLSDLPEGEDKTKHFLASGFLSLTIAKWADKLLPRGLAEKVGVGASIGLGWAKEVYDKFFATGFSREDLQADIKGAKRPFEMTLEACQ